jgi:uncharacterized protein (TIGR03437 family)
MSGYRIVRKTKQFLFLLLSMAAAANATPSIAGIFNAASWAPAGMANGDIAQGSIFVVTGTGLGPATLQQVTSYPLPTTAGIGGTSMQAVINSQAFDCIMIYSSANQVAAIMPSRAVIGTGSLTLTYQGSQTTFPVKVVAASFALFTVNERGSGPGVITDPTLYQVKVPTNPAHAGDTLVAWGTGLGGTTGDETRPPTQVDLNTGVQVFVGNQQATVTYGGRGSSPGLDQINFVVPSGVTGCYVSVAMRSRSVGGVVGNFTTIPIAAPGQTACSDTVGGFSVSNLLKWQSSGSLRTGAVNLQRGIGSQDSVTAGFQSFNFLNLIGSRGLSGAPSPGSCLTLEILTSGGATDISDPVTGSGLDAGAQLTVTGPGGAQSIPASSKGFYTDTFSSFLNPGSYTIKGSGGADVGAFTASLSVPQSINWNNVVNASLVPRSQDLLITWTGAQNDLVEILGTTNLPSTGSLTPVLEFICTALGSAGQFSVPTLVLSTIPNIAEIQAVPAFRLSVSDLAFTPFTASGLDTGYVYSLNFVSTLSAFQ